MRTIEGFSLRLGVLIGIACTIAFGAGLTLGLHAARGPSAVVRLAPTGPDASQPPANADSSLPETPPGPAARLFRDSADGYHLAWLTRLPPKAVYLRGARPMDQQ